MNDLIVILKNGRTLCIRSIDATGFISDLARSKHQGEKAFVMNCNEDAEYTLLVDPKDVSAVHVRGDKIVS